jgi:hypothetical protein
MGIEEDCKTGRSLGVLGTPLSKNKTASHFCVPRLPDGHILAFESYCGYILPMRVKQTLKKQVAKKRAGKKRAVKVPSQKGWPFTPEEAQNVFSKSYRKKHKLSHFLIFKDSLPKNPYFLKVDDYVGDDPVYKKMNKDESAVAMSGVMFMFRRWRIYRIGNPPKFLWEYNPNRWWKATRTTAAKEMMT